MRNCQLKGCKDIIGMKFSILMTLTCLSIVFPVVALSADGEVMLRVKIENLKNSKGKLVVALFDNSDDFLKNTIDEKIVEIEDNLIGQVDFKIKSPGAYAVAAFHDRNANGDLDVVVIIPREPYGFSNDARSLFGPPKFKKAAFDVSDSDLEIAFVVR
jgi:uncharacterized protein (DUF2141 family)